MSLDMLLGYSVNYLSEIEQARKNSPASELQKYIPQEAISLLDIDPLLVQEEKETSHFDEQKRYYSLKLRIHGLPSILIRFSIQFGSWKIEDSNYLWSEFVIVDDKVIRLSEYPDVSEHSYRKEDFLLALGEAVVFAKKLGTYKASE